MVEFRFFFFTLLAMFLALGIGMLIGGSLSGGDALAEKQSVMVTELQRQYQNLKQRERLLNERVNALEVKARNGENFAQSVLPLLVGGRLAGRSVIITATRVQGYHEEIKDLMMDAGAVSARVVAPVVVPLGEGRARVEGRDLALSLSQGENPATTAMVFVSYPGDDQNRLKEFLSGAMAVWGQQGFRVVAAEGVDALPSLVPLYKTMGLPSVDNVDREAGRVSLVYLLAGAEGHYGIKETADAIVPVLTAAAGVAGNDGR